MRTVLFSGALALALGSTAHAAPPEHGAPAPHGAPAAHGAPDAHGDAAHDEHGGDHGGGHGSHAYTADDDGDGTPNWRDSMNGDEPNELYVFGKLGFHLFNLLIFIGLILAFVRRPLQDVLRSRALGIRKGITDSARERDAAKERHDEIAARLQALESEIATLKADARADAAAEAAKMVERARAEADRVAQAAERNIRDEVARARTELRREAVELAVQLAEGVLRDSVNADDQQRLARQFLATLGEGGDTVDA